MYNSFYICHISIITIYTGSEQAGHMSGEAYGRKPVRGGKPPRHLAGLRNYHTKERNSPPPRAPTGWGLAEGGGPTPKVLWAWAGALGGLDPPAPARRRRRTQGGGCAERAGPARWARFVSEAQPTPRGAGGPPLSRLGHDNGGGPQGISIGVRRA